MTAYGRDPDEWSAMLASLVLAVRALVGCGPAALRSALSRADLSPVVSIPIRKLLSCPRDGSQFWEPACSGWLRRCPTVFMAHPGAGQHLLFVGVQGDLVDDEHVGSLLRGG
jgi:hypothetical protein